MCYNLTGLNEPNKACCKNHSSFRIDLGCRTARLKSPQVLPTEISDLDLAFGSWSLGNVPNATNLYSSWRPAGGESCFERCLLVWKLVVFRTLLGSIGRLPVHHVANMKINNFTRLACSRSHLYCFHVVRGSWRGKRHRKNMQMPHNKAPDNIQTRSPLFSVWMKLLLWLLPPLKDKNRQQLCLCQTAMECAICNQKRYHYDSLTFEDNTVQDGCHR